MDEGLIAAEGLDIGSVARARGACGVWSFRALCATMRRPIVRLFVRLAIAASLAVSRFVIGGSMSAGFLSFTTVKRFATLSPLRSLFTLSDLLFVLLVLALKECIATQLARERSIIQLLAQIVLESDRMKVLYLMSDDPRLSSGKLELERTTDHTLELLEVVV